MVLSGAALSAGGRKLAFLAGLAAAIALLPLAVARAENPDNWSRHGSPGNGGSQWHPGWNGGGNGGWNGGWNRGWGGDHDWHGGGGSFGLYFGGPSYYPAPTYYPAPAYDPAPSYYYPPPNYDSPPPNYDYPPPAYGAPPPGYYAPPPDYYGQPSLDFQLNLPLQ